MRLLLLASIALGLCACGIEETRHGAPTNAPASGLGPIAPLEDAAGLDWVPPFILADPARSLSHPSVITDGDSIDLWVGVSVGDRTSIGHARAESFEAGMGPIRESLAATQPWEGTSLVSPSVIRGDGEQILFYVASGKLGLARGRDGSWMRRATPIYASDDPIRAVAAARWGDRVRLALLVGEQDRVDLLELPLHGLDDDRPLWQVRAAELVGAPSWATSMLDLGLRVDRTPAGRWREDLFFGVALPAPLDLGAATPPTAVGAASRYLDFADARLQPVGLPLLSGSPYPRAATACAYRDGVLVFYVARSGPKDAIGVARWP